jgi:hypothetical protein
MKVQRGKVQRGEQDNVPEEESSKEKESLGCPPQWVKSVGADNEISRRVFRVVVLSVVAVVRILSSRCAE